jgi:hypothetical protein
MRGPYIVILSESDPKQYQNSMNSSQNSASLNSSISASLSNIGKYQNLTKPEDLAIIKISKAAPNQYTTSILMAATVRKLGEKI